MEAGPARACRRGSVARSSQGTAEAAVDGG